MGSADVSCVFLDALLRDEATHVKCVVTQPDRPRGRHLKLSPNVVKTQALEAGVPVLTPEKINRPDATEALQAYPADLFVVVAYGQILPPTLLAMPHLGCMNMHMSLLPRHRGAAPIQWAIMAGDAVTGVTAMFMDEGMDTGDIIAQVEEPIGATVTAGELHDRLAQVGADLMVETLASFEAGTASRTPQNPAQVSYASKLSKEDGLIDWTQPASRLGWRIRGLHPWPGCYTRVPGETHAARLKIHAAAPTAGRGAPGEILDRPDGALVIACGEGGLRLLEVQPEGRKRMPGEAYLRGHRLRVGDRIG